MSFTVIASPRAPHQMGHQTALIEGLKALGIKAVAGSALGAKTKFVACWGWRAGKQLRERGHEVLVIERGYLGDRFSWSSLAWNGLNGHGDFGVQPQDNGARFHKHFKVTPWRETAGDHVLIMGQVPGDASLQGRNMMPWYESVAVLAADAYGLPVKFRPHPLAIKKGFRQDPRHCGKSFGTLDEALATAHVVIAYNSNSAVDSVLAGVPTITMDKGAMAWDVTGHNIDGTLTKPDRNAWLSDLAWKQWSIDEIASGEALKGLLEAKGAL